MSLSPAALRKLAALNLNPDQMAGVLDILAEGIEADEARKAAQRERTARAREKARHATVTLQSRDGNSYDTRGGVTRVEDKTSTSKKEPEEKKGSAKRARRLREDEPLPDDWREVAINEGLPPGLHDLEWRKIRDWSLSSPKGAKLDWLATWRSWARRVAAELPKARDGPVVVPMMKDSAANAARRRIDELNAEQREIGAADDHQSFAGFLPVSPERARG